MVIFAVFTSSKYCFDNLFLTRISFCTYIYSQKFDQTIFRIGLIIRGTYHRRTTTHTYTHPPTKHTQPATHANCVVYYAQKTFFDCPFCARNIFPSPNCVRDCLALFFSLCGFSSMRSLLCAVIFACMAYLYTIF